ncbi:MAG: hypothetical protein HY319_18315 [Armatimonadetes bacterium]|nr:hypothetical protein [Armatimonadota bacterium]
MNVVTAGRHFPAQIARADQPTPPTPEPVDQVKVGEDQGDSFLYKLGRGLAGGLGAVVGGVVGAAIGGVRHAGDEGLQFDRKIHTTLRVISAGAGLAAGVAMGLGSLPFGPVVGAVLGPIVGAAIGGATPSLVEAAVDSTRGAFEGGKSGAAAGWNRVTGWFGKEEPPTEPPQAPPQQEKPPQ